MLMQDIIRNGLPLHLFTARNAMALGIGIGVTFIVCNEIYHYVSKRVTEPTEAAICYDRTEANYTPKRAVIPPRGDPETDNRDTHYLAKLKEAERACSVNACSAEGMRTYRGALFWYLSERMRHTRRLDMEYGDTGLARARQIYRSADDVAIEQGLRDRYRAKLFRINDSRQHRDIISTLVFKGGEALRPCRKSDLAS